MAHKCDYNVELTYISSEMIEITYWAKWKDKKLDVLKHTLYLEGQEIIRCRDNLRCSLGGYLVAFPSEKETMHYYGRYEVELGNYYVIDKLPNMSVEAETTDIKDKLKEFYPQYKYLIDKASSKRYLEIYKLIQLAYKTNKLSVIEWLVEHNQYSLITENNLNKNLKADILTFIKNNRQEYNMDIKAIKLAIKERVDYQTAKRCVDYFYSDIKLQDYLLKQNEYISYYNDYKKMCKQLKKNWSDPYWRYPKNLVEAHNKVLDEINELKRLEDIKRNQELNKLLQSKKEKSNKYIFTDGAYKVYFPYDIEDIKAQAEELNQCLITCKYHQEYAEGKTILIFIKKNNKRIATCQITKQKEIRQFYRYEGLDREKAKATPMLKALMDRFLKTLPKEVVI